MTDAINGVTEMRNWLFYKRTGETTVEFRRVGGLEGGSNKPHTGIVAPLNKECDFGHNPTEKEIEQFVRKCGWVAEAPRAHDHPVAQAILNGRW